MDESTICIMVLHCQAGSYVMLRTSCLRKALAAVDKAFAFSRENLAFVQQVYCSNHHRLYSFVIKVFFLAQVIVLFELTSVFYDIPSFIDHFCFFFQDII